MLDRGELHLKDILGSGIGPEVGGVYAHWDHLRHLSPPAGMSLEAWWAAIKRSRKAIERALLLHAIRHPHSAYEIAGHQATQRVSYPSARAGLIGLVALGLLSQEQIGKSFLFRPVADLARRLEQ